MDTSQNLQHPRRNLGSRFRAQAERFVKLAKANNDDSEVNLAWAEQNSQQSILHDFTDERNWLTLAHVKLLREDGDGIRYLLTDLFDVLGRDPDLVGQLSELNFIKLGYELMSATFENDPLNPTEWWILMEEKGLPGSLDKFCDRCKRLDFRDSRANVIFGRRLEKMLSAGYEEMFIETINYLLAHRPSNFELWKELGGLHERRGEIDDAWLCYDQVQRFSPNSEIKDSFLQRLKNRMDFSGNLAGPSIDKKVKFQQKMELLVTRVSTVVDEPEHIESKSETYNQDEEQLKQWISNEEFAAAFFLARRLISQGETWASSYLNSAKLGLENADEY